MGNDWKIRIELFDQSLLDGYPSDVLRRIETDVRAQLQESAKDVSRRLVVYDDQVKRINTKDSAGFVLVGKGHPDVESLEKVITKIDVSHFTILWSYDDGHPDDDIIRATGPRRRELFVQEAQRLTRDVLRVLPELDVTQLSAVIRQLHSIF